MAKHRVGLGLGQTQPDPINKELKPDPKKPYLFIVRVGSSPTRIGTTSGRAKPDPTKTIFQIQLQLAFPDCNFPDCPRLQAAHVLSTCLN